MRWLAGGLLVWLALGCTPVTNVCNERKESVLRANGDAYRCTIANDCPRDSNVLVCTTNRALDRDCVSCDETSPGEPSRCVRHIVVWCQ